MAPNAETDDMITMTSDFSKVHSLKAAIFHTMAFKLSLEKKQEQNYAKMSHCFLKGPLQCHPNKEEKNYI